MDELDSAFFSIENKKSKYENRLNAIINISDTLRDLDELCEKNLISFHEKETKRNELINQSKISSSGDFSSKLEELIESGFVTDYPYYQNKKQLTLYRLSDE